MVKRRRQRMESQKLDGRDIDRDMDWKGRNVNTGAWWRWTCRSPGIAGREVMLFGRVPERHQRLTVQ